jgi:hypothetical protein
MRHWAWGNGHGAMVSQRGLGGLPHERLANPEGGIGQWAWGIGNNSFPIPSPQSLVPNPYNPMPFAI